MIDHIGTRNKIVMGLKEELMGPSSAGKEINCDEEIVFTNLAESIGPWRQKKNGEEVLCRDTPCKRYGVAVLYPFKTPLEMEPQETNVGKDSSETEAVSIVDDLQDKKSTLTSDIIKDIEAVDQRKSIEREVDPEDFDLSTANSYKPNSMGISFLVRMSQGSKLYVEAVGGRYTAKTVRVGKKDFIWWLRSPVKIVSIFSSDNICSTDSGIVKPVSVDSQNTNQFDLRIELFARKQKSDPRQSLVTVCLINRSRQHGKFDEACLFQSGFKVSIQSPDGQAGILPYPHSEGRILDPEEQSLALLYRESETFAVGHGCAANWPNEIGEAKVTAVSAECLPSYEAPSITPDIRKADGSLLEINMKALAGIDKDNDGFKELEDLLDAYSQWIEERKKEVSQLKGIFTAVASRHIQAHEKCFERIKEGMDFIRSNSKPLQAFRLANHAILQQQLRSRGESRKANYDSQTRRIIFSEQSSEPDFVNLPTNKGKWRPFQIAFLLMSLRSTSGKNDLERKIVELIWFPTGGGKTEAYLALAAYTIFLRRLENQNDMGVNVLMRYTLRLLTTQQFQRASSLICAMEYLREKSRNELGDEEFSIGIWVGSGNTPNTRSKAKQDLRKLRRDEDAENPFVLTKCPWCRAQMGPLRGRNIRVPDAFKVLGYVEKEQSIAFRCPDATCFFSRDLPIYVIDEDIYEKRPSMIIGTVDKFALLAWKPESRAIFGIDHSGERFCSPPSLIIQDELHLISGPLGSMVGLYEVLIEELCTDRRDRHKPVFPKIICSTATIRRYEKQIKDLFGREQASLFPPPGLSIHDSFFAKYARDAAGNLKRGRIYVGVHAPGLGSMQTVQVRTFSALLQAPVILSPEERDPWWTLLIFFNSLRELGTTLSLIQSDIPDYFEVMRQRYGLDYKNMRRFWHLKELTSRLKDDEVPLAMSKLETSTTTAGEHPVDICLASNIIEVGIDIDRLSVMSIVGQPKTTSQYIQVSGRVGRSWWERPGLVVTLYSVSKPRDRSHFEKFRSYHECLYAQVEPTTVTPFSSPAIDRALNAIMIAYVRQLGNIDNIRSPYPFPLNLIEDFRKIIMPRVRMVDPEEAANVERVFNKRVEQWKRWQRNIWTASSKSSDLPLMKETGSYVTRQQANLCWMIPTSMRNVDSECQAEVTQLYLNSDVENNNA